MEKRLNHLRCLFVCIFSLFLSLSYAQIDTGTYSGTMHLKPKAIGLDSIEVKLKIQQLNDTLFVWKMSYPNSMEKNYRLIVIGDHYLLDELNGILLPGYMEKGILSFRYEVNEVLYLVVYDLSEPGAILFDLQYFHKTESFQIEENSVRGYILSGRQYARLKKQVELP